MSQTSEPNPDDAAAESDELMEALDEDMTADELTALAIFDLIRRRRSPTAATQGEQRPANPPIPPDILTASENI